jgi:hypothetical protein
MNLDQIYDNWDVSDSGPIETCCRIRDELDATCMIVAISRQSIHVDIDSDLQAIDCWHEIEHFDKPKFRFSREHAIIVYNSRAAKIDSQATFESLAAMKAKMFMTMHCWRPLCSRLIAKANRQEIMGMFWPPHARPVGSSSVLN